MNQRIPGGFYKWGSLNAAYKRWSEKRKPLTKKQEKKLLKRLRLKGAREK